MKLGKKGLAIVLCAVVLISAAGCGKKDGASLLPFGLELGDTYEKTQEKIDIGELTHSSANAGYISDLVDIDDKKQVAEILGTSDGISNVEVGLAYNAEKQLYEFYCWFNIEGDKAWDVHDTIREKYTKIAGEEEAEPTGIALWLNDEYVIDYSCTDPFAVYADETVPYLLVIHSFELDFE